MVYDKETSKPKGYGFMTFPDVDTATSAIRNLDQYEVMGRTLRVDFSDEKSAGPSDGGNSASIPQQPPNGTHIPPPMPLSVAAPGVLPPLPQGQDLPPGVTAVDAISKTLSGTPPHVLVDTLLQMKGLVQSDERMAIDLLRQSQPLAYALFQALLLLGLVENSALANVVQQAQQQYQAAPPQAPPGYPPQHAPYGQPSVAPPGYNAPPPGHYPPGYPASTPQQQQPAAFRPPTQPPPQAAAAAPQLTPEVKAGIMGMSQDQIMGLQPAYRDQILTLRHQIQSGMI